MLLDHDCAVSQVLFEDLKLLVSRVFTGLFHGLFETAEGDFAASTERNGQHAAKFTHVFEVLLLAPQLYSHEVATDPLLDADGRPEFELASLFLFSGFALKFFDFLLAFHLLCHLPPFNFVFVDFKLRC